MSKFEYITIVFEYATITLQAGEILKTGNPLNPTFKRAKDCRKGDLVNIGGFYQHIV